MPKETVASVLEQTATPALVPGAAPVPVPVPAEEMTGLPGAEPGQTVHGTVAELLQARKTAKPKKEDDEKEKQLDEVDKKLQQMLFKGKPKKEPAKEAAKSEEQIAEVPDKKPDVESQVPAKAPAKKPATRDRATELRERELELEKERLALERERLELEKGKAKLPEVTSQETAHLLGMSDDEIYELEIFKAMGEMDGKYSDLARKSMDLARATVKYKAQWQKDNPDRDFDSEDDEHNDFFDNNRIKYDKKDFKRAEMHLVSKGQDDPKLKELEKSNLELKAKDKLRELEPQIAKTWAKYADTMVEAIDPEIVKVTREAGAKAGEALLREFPEEGKEIIAAAEALGVLAQEAFKILEGDGMFIPDESGNRAHARILSIIRQQERVIPQQPRDQRLDGDGRDFSTWEKWLSLTPNERANYWHLGAEEVIDIESGMLAGRVKYELDRAMKIAESRQKRVSGVKKQDEDTEPIKEKPPERRSPSASPGAASKTTVDTPAKAHDSGDDKFTKMIRSALFKRSS